MLTVASLLAAMTIAGAFWVGVLAARRLRDWGEGRRALEEGSAAAPLALAAASGAPPDDAASRKVRALVANRLQGVRLGVAAQPRAVMLDEAPGGTTGPTPATLRPGDVVLVDSGDAAHDGDFIVEGIVNLREGGDTTVVANLADGSRRRWLVAPGGDGRWLWLEPVSDHGLSGEPPRNIVRPRGTYSLARRGQASAATIGAHGRPDASRAATYVYEASSRDVLWVERWGTEVVVGEGGPIERGFVSFLPGS